MTAEPAVQRLCDWFESRPDGRDRFRFALRDSLDEVLDGQRTGRWCYQQLTKTEKTYLGTKVELNLGHEFEIPDGAAIDWNINGQELDCKFSKDLYGWEIPMEMYQCDDHGTQSGNDNFPAVLVWMNDDAAQWAAGIVLVTDSRLRMSGDQRGYNRDNKRRLSPNGLDAIRWLWGGLQVDLPENTLLKLSELARERIFAGRSGQQRLNQLFRERQGVIVSRNTVVTVGQQDDSMKRARDSRLPKHLGSEGIVVLGHQNSDTHIAGALGLPVPTKGEFVACRLVAIAETDRRPSVRLEGRRWAIAIPEEPVAPAPLLPRDHEPAAGWANYLNACS